MDLRKRILTENECYKAGKKINVEGLMLHSTGVNNPNLGRYVDAPELDNVSSNNWNQYRPGGRQVCVHGFIGLDGDDVATYQTLPWNHRGWHGGGSANNSYIGVEICEGDLDDPEYFAKVYKEAVEVFAFLAVKFNLDPMEDIITHCEGYDMGIASNHADVMHWFPKHGKDMDDFRRDVKAEMEGKEIEEPESNPAPVGKSILELAQEVIDGKHGNGAQRKENLGRAYDAVQAKVNELLNGSKPAPARKSVDELAREVIDGKHGSGDARRKSLGSRYDEVQDRVNQLLGSSKPKPEKSIDQLAREVIDGKHGSGAERRNNLGSRYEQVQRRVNEILLGDSNKNSGKSIEQLADEVIKGMHGVGKDRMRSLGSKYAAVQREVNRRL